MKEKELYYTLRTKKVIFSEEFDKDFTMFGTDPKERIEGFVTDKYRYLTILKHDVTFEEDGMGAFTMHTVEVAENEYNGKEYTLYFMMDEYFNIDILEVVDKYYE